MSLPVIAAKEPVKVTVEAGAAKFWCACGRSQNQPFCDGSHRETGISPLKFEVKETKDVWLCQCKQTSKPPYCDGTHRNL